MPASTPRALPAPETAREWLETMTLIRRFEERAGESYARAKIGGFLHLSIGEEATIVGSARALRDTDYLISTYRSHGHALVRGTPPEQVMAELFGRVDGVCHGRGGSMHMFDLARRFMGGYGIVGGNLPIAAGIALSSDYGGRDEVTLCQFGDGASNQGTFGESLNLAALWRLPVVFMVTNNQFGMGTALGRHSAVTDLQRKGESLGVPGVRCDGMDVLDTHAVVAEAVERVREERRPLLIEAVTYRFRGHSMADPEQYRTKEEVEAWRRRDPIPAFGERLVAEGELEPGELEAIDAAAIARVDAAVEFADASPFPQPDALFEDTYVLGDSPHGWYSVETTGERAAGASGGRDSVESANDEIPQQLTTALAAGEEGGEPGGGEIGAELPDRAAEQRAAGG
ncbi:MAG TPA: pyruvate dehydrogenase (acetyl-transferring) E1 component subunit alpha [Solirubrobacteraceae bacterium]|jgi:pyruvate dehydrogenase E1 component alpha subunit|nr:pyruvate dehydrogenase (acetyl-transferring) E1 component subunit alpha [Solirubrobacteraceae bacterium]